MEKRQTIVIIGGATYDITFFPNDNESFLIDNKQDILRQKLLAFEHGAKISSKKVVHGFGGGAANAAVSFANFGFKTSVITAIGNDIFGREIVANFKRKKVSVNLVQKIPSYASDLAVIIVGPDKDRLIFREDNVKNKLELNRQDINAIKRAKWVYIASLAGDWRVILGKIFAIKNKNESLKIAWNPGQSQLNSDLSELGYFLKHTDVLILNQDEALQVAMLDPKTKENNKNLNQMNVLLSTIKNYGSKIVVITCGKDGVWVFDGKKTYYSAIIEKKERVDTTGVGDAFGSSFIAGLELFSGDIDRSIKLGVFNTSSVVAEPGAQNGLLTKKDIEVLRI